MARRAGILATYRSSDRLGGGQKGVVRSFICALQERIPPKHLRSAAHNTGRVTPISSGFRVLRPAGMQGGSDRAAGTTARGLPAAAQLFRHTTSNLSPHNPQAVD